MKRRTSILAVAMLAGVCAGPVSAQVMVHDEDVCGGKLQTLWQCWGCFIKLIKQCDMAFGTPGQELLLKACLDGANQQFKTCLARTAGPVPNEPGKHNQITFSADQWVVGSGMSIAISGKLDRVEAFRPSEDGTVGMPLAVIDGVVYVDDASEIPNIVILRGFTDAHVIIAQAFAVTVKMDLNEDGAVDDADLTEAILAGNDAYVDRYLR